MKINNKYDTRIDWRNCSSVCRSLAFCQNKQTYILWAFWDYFVRSRVCHS